MRISITNVYFAYVFVLRPIHHVYLLVLFCYVNLFVKRILALIQNVKYGIGKLFQAIEVVPLRSNFKGILYYYNIYRTNKFNSSIF